MTVSESKSSYAQQVRLSKAQEVRLGWVEALRARALKAFDEKGFPDKSWESWRYFTPSKLLSSAFEKPVPAELLSKEDPIFSGARCRIVFVDGLFSPKLSSQAPGNVDFSELWSGLFNHPELETRLGRDLDKEDNPFSLINTFAFEDGALIMLPSGRQALEPLHLFFFTTGTRGPVASVPRILLVAEEGAEVSVVARFYGGNHGQNSFENAVAEIHADAGARVRWTNLQIQENESGSLFLQTRAYLKEKAELDMVTVTRGREITRNEIRAELEGPGAQCRISGLSVLSGRSQAHQALSVLHRSPGAVSRQIYKNLLDGQSRAEFNSLAEVCPGAQKSDSHQLNKNLLLSDDARVYSRPKLKIYADDVQAAHGSATGQADPGELFYLRSRGLDLRTARFVLAYGFAEEILSLIPEKEVRAEIEASVKNAVHAMVRG